MTNHAHGSSLLQAPEAPLHQRHSFAHNKDGAAAAPDAPAVQPPVVHADQHVHLHAEFHQKHHQQQQQQHAHHHHQHIHNQHLPPGRQQGELRRRQTDDTGVFVTHVIQTVSVIQYVDGSGATLDVSTVYLPVQTQLVDQVTGLTSEVGDVLSSAATILGGDAQPSPTETSPVSSATPGEESTLSLTSAPSSSSAFPSLQSVFNSSSSATTLFSNQTSGLSFKNSSTSSTTFSSSSSRSETTLSFISTETASTALAGGDGGSGGAGTGIGVQPTGTSSAASPATTQTPTSTVVGSVVGSICGLALVIFAAIFILRWKKQRSNGHRLTGGENDWGSAPALPAGPSGSPVPGSRSHARGFSQRMSERGLPFAVPATLAALSGGVGGGSSKRALAELPGDGGSDNGGGERGFYRISGRKLPSVLQHGGDGYSHPHERNDSTLSGTSFYRDSEGHFFGGTGQPAPRVAVGSPMRPDSGVPIMQPGPARTPVTGHISSSPGLTPPPSRDPLGRSHSSQDGSRGSQSRFHEDIS